MTGAARTRLVPAAELLVSLNSPRQPQTASGVKVGLIVGVVVAVGELVGEWLWVELIVGEAVAVNVWLTVGLVVKVWVVVGVKGA